MIQLRPSALPCLAQCPRWQGDDNTGQADKSAGTARHRALSAALKSSNMDDACAGMEDADRGIVEWAHGIISVGAPMQDHPLRTDWPVNPMDDEFHRLFPNGGTLDACCGPNLWDLKNDERDYVAQMAAYSLGMMQEDGWAEVKATLLFGKTRRAHTITFTYESAYKIVGDIVKAVQNPESKPAKCDYCKWCALRLTCPAALAVVKTVATGYSEEARAKSWHPSKMETAEELAEALWLWRNVLEAWGRSIEFHALESAQKKGMTLPGFELKTKRGRQFVTDAAAAFGLAGLPQEDFLKACSVRLNTSKTYPDQVGVIDLYAKQTGLKKAPAGRDLLRKLEPVIKTGNDSIYLAAVKTTGEEPSEE